MAGPVTREQLEVQRTKLEAALRKERAEAAAERAGIPVEHFGGILSELPEDSDLDEAARSIGVEIRSRVGSPAGPESPSDEGGASPISGPRGDLPLEGEEEFSEPENLEALAAVVRSGPEGGTPLAPPAEGEGALSEAIAATESWQELEALQQMKRRR